MALWTVITQMKLGNFAMKIGQLGRVFKLKREIQHALCPILYTTTHNF
jgi:hypothetical protein